jgi:hypothetical protein
MRLKSYGGVGAAQQEATQEEMAARDRLEGQRQSAVANQAFSIQNETNDDLMSQYQLALQQAQAEYQNKYTAWFDSVKAAMEKEANADSSALGWATLDQRKAEAGMGHDEFMLGLFQDEKKLAQTEEQFNRKYEQDKTALNYDMASDTLETFVTAFGRYPNEQETSWLGISGLVPPENYGQQTSDYQMKQAELALSRQRAASSGSSRSSGSSSGSSSGGTLTERQNAATSKILAEAKAALNQGYSAQQVRTDILEDYAALTAAGVDFKAVDEYISNYEPVAGAGLARSNIDTFNFMGSLFNAGSANPTASALVKALQDKILLTSR